jgi:hypothetical protein
MTLVSHKPSQTRSCISGLNGDGKARVCSICRGIDWRLATTKSHTSSETRNKYNAKKQPKDTYFPCEWQLYHTKQRPLMSKGFSQACDQQTQPVRFF